MLKKAKLFAARAHQGQVRKYSGEPYITHPLAVSRLVGSVMDDPEVIAAAILHDTVEDTLVTIEDIRFHFGPRVAQLVSEVTDVSVPADGNRAVRKEKDRQHLANASAEGQTIKLADLIHNSASILQEDPKFARTYLSEKRALLEVLTRGNRRLFDQACAIVEAYFF